MVLIEGYSFFGFLVGGAIRRRGVAMALPGDATALNELDYVVFLPSVETCVQPVLTRQGHEFPDEAATRKMDGQLSSAQISRRHVSKSTR